MSAETFYLEYYLCKHRLSMSFNKPRGCRNRLNFIQIHCEISEKMNTENVVFQTYINMQSLVVSIILPRLKEISLQANVKGAFIFLIFFLLKSQKVGFSPLNIEWTTYFKKCECGFVHHTNKSQQYTSFHTN